MAMEKKGLTKLTEELGELTAIASKKMAYFNTDVHPDSDILMSTRKMEEMGDVLAAIEFVVMQFSELDMITIQVRKIMKLELYEKWKHDPADVI